MEKARRFVAWILALALLLCGCGVTTPSGTTADTTSGTAAPEGTDGPEAVTDWTLTGEWTVTTDGEGKAVTLATAQSGQARYDGGELPDGWVVNAQVEPDSSDARILLYKSNGKAEISVTLKIENGKAQLSVDEWKYSRWKNLTEGTDWVSFNESLPLVVQVSGYDGKEGLKITLLQNNNQLVSFTSTDVSARTVSMVNKVGVGTDGSAVFSDFNVGEKVNPMAVLLSSMDTEDEGFYLAIAKQAVADMLANFWTGDTETGKILPTWSGYATEYDWRGSIWETAMLVFEIYDMWQLTGDEYYFDLLTAEAKFFRENFTEQELEAAGELFHWASDDCAWNAQMYLVYYAVTGDEWFVDRAIGLLDKANERWYNEELGGLYYKDDVEFMSLYEVGIAMAWLRLWEITGEQRFYDLALRSYEGMHDRLSLGRDDGIYFIEATVEAAIGYDRPDDIKMAGSVSFLTGNMGMAALAAKFYKITEEQEYLDRVYRINEGLLEHYNADGILLNDRDAWTNGVYAAYYTAEVLSLPDTEEMQTLLKNTAVSIVTNARTVDGYYGGRWAGPADGEAGIWGSGSAPQQSMTTGTSVLMVVAAAILEAGIEGYGR